ncbi:MAG: hypothetical protein KC731_06030 [Myxococcales bacterium]|nr:hypothetical protein [Myxococcales bacterium]
MKPGVESVLALLLAAQAPGRSPYSKIAVDDCDARCQETPLCERPELSCRPPHFVARRGQHFRYETWEEGVRRYASIADSVHRAATTMTWPKDGDCDLDDETPACVALQKKRPWTGSERLLEVLLTTVALHESGLRRDVHEGTTRGDCDYTMQAGVEVAIPGTCRSTCLGQIKLEDGQTTSRGYGREDLPGLDDAATFRCVETMVDRLSQARELCVAQQNGSRAGHYAGCTFGIYGGVEGWSKDPRIAERVKTYRRLLQTSTKVSEAVKQVLAKRDPP